MIGAAPVGPVCRERGEKSGEGEGGGEEALKLRGRTHRVNGIGNCYGRQNGLRCRVVSAELDSPRGEVSLVFGDRSPDWGRRVPF